MLAENMNQEFRLKKIRWDKKSFNWRNKPNEFWILAINKLYVKQCCFIVWGVEKIHEVKILKL